MAFAQLLRHFGPIDKLGKRVSAVITGSGYVFMNALCAEVNCSDNMKPYHWLRLDVSREQAVELMQQGLRSALCVCSYSNCFTGFEGDYLFRRSRTVKRCLAVTYVNAFDEIQYVLVSRDEHGLFVCSVHCHCGLSGYHLRYEREGQTLGCETLLDLAKIVESELERFRKMQVL